MYKENREYVIYARRSTEEEERQKASIPQQLEDCFKCFENQGICLKLRPQKLEVDQKTVDEIQDDNESNPEKARKLIDFYNRYYIITERGSAKKPYERNKWRELIKLISSGKVIGLLGYSPDRFSRNLLEAGELLDHYGLNNVDLKFSQITAENTATGHMLLGMLFIQSTFYSKKLGEDVTRGISKKHLEGYALGHNKYGYTINEDGRYEPHPTMFKLLREAFEKKLYENWADTKIVEYLNENGWRQNRCNNASKSLTTNKFSQSNIWNDTFYYGLHKKTFKGKEIFVDLRNLSISGYQFNPMITENEYFLLQEKLAKPQSFYEKVCKSAKSRKNDCIKPIPNGAIIYAKTGTVMQHTLPSPMRYEKKAQEQNKELWQVVKPHQIKYRYNGKADRRFKPITYTWEQLNQPIQSILESIQIDQKAFENYQKAQTLRISKEKTNRTNLLQGTKLALAKNKQNYQQFLTATNYGQNLANEHKEAWQKEDNQHQEKIKGLESKVQKLQTVKNLKITKEEQLIKVLQEIPKRWGKANYVRKRNILKTIGLNIKVHNEERLEITINPALESIFDGKIQGGGGLRIRFEQLSNFVKSCDIRLWQRIEGLYNEFFGTND